MAGPSRRLSGPLLGEAESFYNNDLSATRLHDDPTAQRAATALGADAMTVGTHVFLGPAAHGRKDVIGHELGHVDKNLRGDRETGHDNGAGVGVTDPGQTSERIAAADGAAFAAGAATAPSVVAQRAAVEDAPAEQAHAAVPAVQRITAGPGGVLTADPDSVVQRLDRGTRSHSHSVRRSERRRRVNVDRLPRYLRGPEYTLIGAREGGCHSTATLGPNGYVSAGSDADPSLPTKIREARQHYGINFKAGHLLNADFGGTGRHADNLTILTPGANSRHRSFDDPLKIACDKLRRVYEMMADQYLPVDELRYGIHIDVRTSGNKWEDHGPGKYITERLYCRASVVGINSVMDMLLEDVDDPNDPSLRPIYAMTDVVQEYVDLANEAAQIEND
jgi:hypothetical protein